MRTVAGLAAVYVPCPSRGSGTSGKSYVFRCHADTKQSEQLCEAPGKFASLCYAKPYITPEGCPALVQ